MPVPAGGPAGEDEDEDALEEGWRTLPHARQWEYALLGLRRQFEAELEMTPRNWGTYRFGHEVNGFQLVESLYSKYG
jgi:hypothetical protein